MERPYPSLEFEVEVSKDGMIQFPPAIARRFHVGSRVTVRITDGIISAALRKRMVTEGEVEHIASMQLEQREQVIDFLSVEGAMAKNTSFRTRARTLLKRRS